MKKIKTRDKKTEDPAKTPKTNKISRSKAIKIIIRIKNCIEKIFEDVLESLLKPASIEKFFGFSLTSVSKKVHATHIITVILKEIKKYIKVIKIKSFFLRGSSIHEAK